MMWPQRCGRTFQLHLALGSRKVRRSRCIFCAAAIRRSRSRTTSCGTQTRSTYTRTVAKFDESSDFRSWEHFRTVGLRWIRRGTSLGHISRRAVQSTTAVLSSVFHRTVKEAQNFPIPTHSAHHTSSVNLPLMVHWRSAERSVNVVHRTHACFVAHERNASPHTLLHNG